MNVYIVVTGIVLATVLGDYFLKLSSQQANSFSSMSFWVGTLFYSFTAAGWMLAMKHLSLATIGVYYSVLTILLLTGLGVFVFKEELTLREGIGIVFALLALGLMTRHS